MDFDKELTEFKKFLLDEEFSPNTSKTYMICLGKYFKWYEESYDYIPEKLLLEPIKDFLSYMKTVEVVKGETLMVYISSLKAYCRFKGQDTLMDSVRLPKIQKAFTNPNRLSQKEVENFRLKVLDKTGRRNYAIVTLMAYGGLRISEVLDLRVEDVNLETKQIIVRSGKGDKQRVVFMSTKVRDALSDYLQERNTDLEWLFVSQKGNRIHRSTINRLFNENCSFTPHDLRHFFCTRGVEVGGLAIHELASIVGHRDINTSKKYLHPSQQEIYRKINLI